MTRAEAPHIRFETPTGDLFPGRGFYQLEEDALYVQVAPFSSNYRFFSYLDSEQVHFELDRTGRLLFVEISKPRRQWEVVPGLTLPNGLKRAELRWLDFRQSIPEPSFRCDRYHTTLQVRFLDTDNRQSFLLAENVAVDITDDSRLAALWIDSIIDDLAGQNISLFRKLIRNSLSA